jgi:excisionase family DNA binding protein
MTIHSTDTSYDAPEGARPLAVSVKAACKLTGIGRTLMFELIKDGRVGAIKIGRRRLVIYASLVALCSGGPAS